MGLPLKNFVEMKASPPKEFHIFYSISIEILNFYILPLKNSMVPQPGGGGGGGGVTVMPCNGAVNVKPFFLTTTFAF